MIKEIKYTGLSARPSDYECPDGSLDFSLNLLNENGSLAPVAQPVIEKAIPSGAIEALFIHKANGFTHYIMRAGENKIGWIDADSNSSATTEFAETYYSFKGLHVNAVGNTLLIFTSTGINYYLWKGDAYKYLGDHIPDIGISFGLVGHPRLYSVSDDSHDTFEVSFEESIHESDIMSTFSEKNKTAITSQVMAKVNKFVADQTIRKGRFCFPFLVRFALRLYDGSLVGHSAPILMNPSTTSCPVVLWNRISGEGSKLTKANLDIMLVAASLDYRIAYDNDHDWMKIPDWTDIVKSVDIFISKPLYTFDQNGECESFGDSDDFQSRFVGRLHHENATRSAEFLPAGSEPKEDMIIGPVAGSALSDDTYAEWRYSDIYALYFSADRSYPSTTLHLPEYSDDKELENIRNCSNFYKLCSIDIKTVYDNRLVRTDIKVEDEYLQSLVAREAMTDDYLSHDRLRAANAFCYNNRLNLGGVSRKLFNGFGPAAAFAFVSPCSVTLSFDFANNNAATVSSQPETGNNSLIVFIRENGREYRVSAGGYQLLGVNLRNLIDPQTWTIKTYLFGKVSKTYTGLYKYHWPSYFFYPNTNAYRIAISNETRTFYIDLKPHEFLNGAFAVLDYDNIREDNSASFVNPPADSPTHGDNHNVVSSPNKIYTSEVNNPFYFPLLGINTVGTGSIRAISTAAKALSEGQFGQFPLYAFTDEGVWALEVSATGSYSARQPITRDVILENSQPLQMDSAVLFATDRGVMLISGSQTQCITDTINTDAPFSHALLPGFGKLHAMIGHPDDSCLSATPLQTFIDGCGMLYDYVHQRVIIFNPDFSYAYVYSLRSQLWGMIRSDIKSSLNSYPEALAVDAAGNVVNFSKDSLSYPAGLFVTRPLKLDAPDLLKTVDTVIQRGVFRRGAVMTAIYGSRDLGKWHLVWSSRDQYLRRFHGTPYKYFRIAGIANFSKENFISGCSVSFIPKLTDQLR